MAIVCALIFMCFSLPTAFAEGEIELGDANGDGSVDATDASAVLRHLVLIEAIPDELLPFADADQDEAVSATDAACILRYVVKIDTIPPSTAPVPPPVEERPDLSGKVIFLDPGHGYDSVTGSLYGGRMAVNGLLTYAEADRVLTFALETKALLEEHGATVILTRSDRYMVGNYVRVSMVHKYALNQLKLYDSELATEPYDPSILLKIAEYDRLIGIMDAIIGQYRPGTDEDNGELAKLYYFTPYDNSRLRVIHPDTKLIYEYEKDPRLANMVYISLHTNASAGSQSGLNRGLLVYCTDNTYNPTYYDGYQAENSLRLGDLLNTHVSEQTGLNKRSEKVIINDYFMTRENNLPAVLLEIGYHDNADDLAIITADKTPANVANGILLALSEYFG
ncbi:MAG: N-acetylmuramoyl-L-alanine amidase [Clostridia bacterium]|nr:N-acetylmuramoyl-L-alanine amidase [Clostridia bacterium]